MSNIFDVNKRLSPEEQQTFLASRGCPPGLIGPTFDRCCNFLFAITGVAIHTESHEVNNTKIGSVFPADYRPTYAEVFDTIARQTRSTMRYDPDRNYWVFNPPAQPLPYAIALADGWRAEDRGLYVCYIPSVAPVGLDIYMTGRYSSDTPDPELFRRVRECHALRFLAPISKATIADMTPVTVAGVEALFYQTSAVPKPNNTWRQWVFVVEGQCFSIASSIDFPQEEQLWPDVQAMVQSFHLIDPTPHP